MVGETGGAVSCKTIHHSSIIRDPVLKNIVKILLIADEEKVEFRCSASQVFRLRHV